MTDEPISHATVRLLRQYLGSMLRRTDRLVEAELARMRRPRTPRATRPRWFELAQAAEAARALIEKHQYPTFELIHEYIEKHHEPGLSIHTLRSRWRMRGRSEPPITMPEVREEARR